MATRFYFASRTLGDRNAQVNPAADAGWEVNPNERLELLPWKTGAATATRGRAGSGVSGQDLLMYQWVSRPMHGPGTFDGTVKGMIGVFEAATTDNYNPAFVAKIVSNDGTVVRGTLLAQFGGGTEFGLTPAASVKFPPGWTGSGSALSSVAYEDGDRLVIEVGWNQTSTSVGSAQFELGNPYSKSDYSETEGATGGVSWVEFSYDIQWQQEFVPLKPSVFPPPYAGLKTGYEYEPGILVADPEPAPAVVAFAPDVSRYARNRWDLLSPARRDRQWDVAAMRADAVAANVTQTRSFRAKKLVRGHLALVPDAQDISVLQARHHLSLPMLRRKGRLLERLWTQIAVITTVWPPSVLQRRKHHVALVRRGGLVEPPRIGADIFFGLWKTGNIRNKVRFPITKRGKRSEVTPAGADILFGLWKQQPTRVRARGVATRRARLFSSIVQAGLPSAVRPTRRSSIFTKRGRRAEATPVQAVAPSAPNLPLLAQRTRRFTLSLRRRGKILQAPLTGAALNAFIWLPKYAPRRLRSMVPARRTRKAETVSTQAAVVTTWTPQNLTKRTRLLLSRRGQLKTHLPVPQLPALSPRRKTRALPRRRQGRVRVFQVQDVVRNFRRKVAMQTPVRRMRRWNLPVPQIVVIVAQKYVPAITRNKRLQAMLHRSRGFGSFIRIGAHRVFDAITTGEFARGDTGHTEDPQAGDTEQSSDGEVL